MNQTPRLLRRRGDPLDAVRLIIDDIETTARSSRVRYLGSSRPSRVERGVDHTSQHPGPERIPLLVMAASGIDGLRVEPLETDAVIPIDDVELRSAALRAGLDGFEPGSPDSDRLRGALIALRGAAGEQWVLDRLRDRELPAPDGAVSVEMLPFTSPGVDLVFADMSGSIVGTANVKVARSADVIVRHFDRHPDVSLVYATSDAAADAAARGIRVIGLGDAIPDRSTTVVDIGQSSSDFDDQIGTALAGNSAVSGWGMVDLVPWTSTAAIGIRAMIRLRAGAPGRDVARQASSEATAAGAATAAARLASQVTNSEPSVALIAMLTSALTFGALDVRRSWLNLPERLMAATEFAEALARRAPA